MSRSHRAPIRSYDRPLPVDTFLAQQEQHAAIDALIHGHRDALVAVARNTPRGRRDDPEDIVQDVCLAVLDGELRLSRNPERALDQLFDAVCARGGREL